MPQSFLSSSVSLSLSMPFFLSFFYSFDTETQSSSFVFVFRCRRTHISVLHDSLQSFGLIGNIPQVHHRTAIHARIIHTVKIVQQRRKQQQKKMVPCSTRKRKKIVCESKFFSFFVSSHFTLFLVNFLVSFFAALFIGWRFLFHEKLRSFLKRWRQPFSMLIVFIFILLLVFTSTKISRIFFFCSSVRSQINSSVTDVKYKNFAQHAGKEDENGEIIMIKSDKK